MKRFALLMAVLLPASAALSLTPPPPQPHNQLFPMLYEAMGGEHWHRSDGWFDPDVHWCDWYGVTCGDEFWPGLFLASRPG